MAETSRRQTRSQSAQSRARSQALSSDEESQVPGSVRTRGSTRRTTTKKDTLDTETSGTYGSKGQRTHAQQLASADAMKKAVGVIETELTSAGVAGPSNPLPPIEEDEPVNSIEDQEVGAPGVGRVSRIEESRLTVKLTEAKSFDTEVSDETNTDTPDRDESLVAQIRARHVRWSPFFALLSLGLLVFIAFISGSMWAGWRPKDNRLLPGEYNRSFVRGEFLKLNHALEGRGRQIEVRLSSYLDERMKNTAQSTESAVEGEMVERLEGWSQKQDERIGEWSQRQDERVGEWTQKHDDRIGEWTKKQDEHLNSRIGEWIVDREQKTEKLIDATHQTLRALENRFETLNHQLVQPMDHQINWFSRGLASVNTQFSSPTLARPLTFTETLVSIHWKFGKLPTWLTNQIMFEDPISILYPWSTFGQKWCAPSTRGKLQAVVRLAYRIAPTAIVVEHMSKDLMPDVEIGTAPKEVELWMQILDDEVRHKVGKAITGFFPSILTKTASQRDKPIHPPQALDPTWVPVGQWNYDIHDGATAQTMYVPLDLLQMNVTTQSVAIRVNSNWGSTDSTCLYRVRLYGHYREAPTVYSDLEEIPDEKPSEPGYVPWRRMRVRHDA